jgi:hypothetical protein
MSVWLWRGGVMRWFPILLCIACGGCSIPMDDLAGPTPYVPPGAPSSVAKTQGLRKAIAEEKLSGKVEVSNVRMSDRGWGRYMVCLKGRRDKQASGYYSVFFDNDDYKGVRESVIYDFCAQQSFRPMA